MSVVKEYGSYLLPVRNRFLLRSGQQDREEELVQTEKSDVMCDGGTSGVPLVMQTK
jgi:hypothetical protein